MFGRGVPMSQLTRRVFDTPAETIRSAERKEVAGSVLLFPLLNGLGFLCVHFFFNRNTHRKGKVVGSHDAWEGVATNICNRVYKTESKTGREDNVRQRDARVKHMT